MKIEYYKDYKPQKVEFSAITEGGCFITQILINLDDLPAKKLYMKLKTTNFSPFVKNAIDLETGSLCFFEPDVEVTPLFYPDIKIVAKEIGEIEWT